MKLEQKLFWCALIMVFGWLILKMTDDLFKIQSIHELICMIQGGAIYAIANKSKTESLSE